ncbi:Cation channel sperm-associated protein 2 [Sorochytrium milnesiophthora]
MSALQRHNLSMMLEDNANSNELDNAFHDLSRRSSLFRTRLLDEFQLLDNLSLSTGVSQPPQFNTRDVADPEAFVKIMAEEPYNLIKFQAFKRTRDNGQVDRRLTRVKNKHSLPIGAWAGWLLASSTYQNSLLIVIILNAVVVGVSAEYQDSEDANYGFFQALTLIDIMSLFVFYVEILLKWFDNFWDFWRDNWNLFDFLVTLGTTLPDVLTAIMGTNNQIALVLRPLRTFRILRTLKLAVRFGSLRIIVITIIEAFKSMALIMMLVLMVTYIFAIVGIYGFETYTNSPNTSLQYRYSFQDLPTSLETLFQFLTLDNWTTVLGEMIQASDPVFSYVFVILWVFIGAFIFKNIFVGVMVSNFDKISNQLRAERAEMLQSKKIERMRKKLKKELTIAQTNIKASMDNLNAGVEAQRKASEEEVSGRKGGVASNGTAGLSPTADDTAPSTPRLASTRFLDGGDEQDHDDGTGKNVTYEQSAIVDDVQKLLNTSHTASKDWEMTVAGTLQALLIRGDETVWPRDSLFRYFQLMESLQENMREYQELQTLANLTLLELHDT